VISGTICEPGVWSKDHLKSKKSTYGAIFTGKDKSLADGTYVFRIGGALSREHTHGNTKWELCGRRGTSDEELKFRMNQGVCTVLEHRSRWEMTGALVLSDFSGALVMHMNDPTTAEALDDASFNEDFVTELESALFSAISSIIGLVTKTTVIAVTAEDGVLRASFGIRLNTASYSAAQNEKNQLLAAELQSQLASYSSVTRIVDELHKYPEFAAISNVVVSNVIFDGDFHGSSQDMRQYDTKLNGQQTWYSNIHWAYVLLGMAMIVNIAVVTVFVARR
jgi:hypothetical protein